MMRPLKIKGNKVRIGMAALFFGLMFLGVVVRAFQLQVIEGEKLRRLGERQHLKEAIVYPKRGTILDRSGEPLALSLQSQSVYVRPRRIAEPEAVARTLAKALSLNTSDVQQKVKAEKPFVWLKRQVTPNEAEKIKGLNLDGVGLYYEPNRYYPQGQVAGQIVGFVSRDSDGLEGVELRYDNYIRGAMASPLVERDALGRKVLTQGVEELQVPPGADIHLTLDTSIQYLAEKQLEAAVTKFRAKSGIAIVVEPFTGEVLAMANYPFFDPNNFTRQSSQHWRNRAATDSFEPGSTFKTITAAAALEEGVVQKEDLFYCEDGKYFFGGKTIHDSHRYGWLPFYKIIQYSSNIGATKVAEKLKKERLYRYIEKFGFGKPTGIDMPGEVAGLLRSADSWSTVDLATHSFGQGIAVTPIQLVMAYAAVANGGFLMRPFIVRRVVGPDGTVLEANQPHVVRRVISEKTARLLTSILKGVVTEGGTGVMASVEGFDVAGKTGTAQKADLANGGYAAKKRVASFVGFVPAEHSRMVLLVLIDEPEVNVYGGIVAAPTFRSIARGALRHLGVFPERTEGPFLPMQQEASSMQAERRTNPIALKQESEHEVPDFHGLSMREALEKARTLKLRVEVRGNGYVVKQSPAAGRAWDKNETLSLELQG
jgi:cell division protein FtsI (penicillin-binding protein 3)